jgi:hypothetical protein
MQKGTKGRKNTALRRRSTTKNDTIKEEIGGLKKLE